MRSEHKKSNGVSIGEAAAIYFCQEADGGDSQMARIHAKSIRDKSAAGTLRRDFNGVWCSRLVHCTGAAAACRAHRRGYRPSRCTCTSCSSPAGELQNKCSCNDAVCMQDLARAPLWSGSFCVTMGQHVALLKNLSERTPLLAHSPTFVWHACRVLNFLRPECIWT